MTTDRERKIAKEAAHRIASTCIWPADSCTINDEKIADIIAETLLRENEELRKHRDRLNDELILARTLLARNQERLK